MKPLLLHELESEGRLYVPYPADLRAAVAAAMKSWEAFEALPQEARARFEYEKDTKTSGTGYEMQRVKDGRPDEKDDMHLRVIKRDFLMGEARKVDDTIAPKFIEDALAIVPAMVPVIQQFAEAVEQTYAIQGFAEDVMAWKDQWLIRFLNYLPSKAAGEEIAAPHVDKGGFTLHLYESDEGVERLTYDTKEWKPFPLSHTETAIIPGMGLQNRSKGKLRALCHRVTANETTATKGRLSAVCFFNFANARFYDKATYGPLQGWPPGAFYDMPFDELDKLFID